MKSQAAVVLLCLLVACDQSASIGERSDAGHSIDSTTPSSADANVGVPDGQFDALVRACLPPPLPSTPVCTQETLECLRTVHEPSQLPACYAQSSDPDRCERCDANSHFHCVHANGCAAEMEAYLCCKQSLCGDLATADSDCIYSDGPDGPCYEVAEMWRRCFFDLVLDGICPRFDPVCFETR